MRALTHSSPAAIGSALPCSSDRFYERLEKLRWAFYHPLTADAPWSAINRFLKFQIASRVCALSMVVPYVDDTKLMISNDISPAYSNPIYCGLPEFEDMGFVLHLLTDDDLFGDVGANVGVYSVLASGVRGAKTVAMEPVPSTREALRLNIVINKLEGVVDILEIGVGAEPGELGFTTDEGSCNHVVQDGSGCRVPVLPLDQVFAARTPILLKIDVEGFETNVIKGAQRLLKDTALKAVLMEMMGCGTRYGFDERRLDSEMRRFGFNSFLYDPWSRKLNPSDPNYRLNTIYVRDLVFVEHRLRAAKPFRVLRHLI
jgi:FkbM family methyltransferase